MPAFRSPDVSITCTWCITHPGALISGKRNWGSERRLNIGQGFHSRLEARYGDTSPSYGFRSPRQAFSICSSSHELPPGFEPSGLRVCHTICQGRFGMKVCGVSCCWVYLPITRDKLMFGTASCESNKWARGKDRGP